MKKVFFQRNADPNLNAGLGGGSSLAGNQREQALTLGQYRVGVNFNPGGHPAVNTIKALAALAIDALVNHKFGDDKDLISKAVSEVLSFVSQLNTSEDVEVSRLYKQSLSILNDVLGMVSEIEQNNEAAQLLIEDAAMWAVKAVTKTPYVAAEAPKLEENKKGDQQPKSKEPFTQENLSDVEGDKDLNQKDKSGDQQQEEIEDRSVTHGPVAFNIDTAREFFIDQPTGILLCKKGDQQLQAKNYGEADEFFSTE